MEYNFKSLFKRKLLTFILLLSLVSSTLYLPAFTPRAMAGIPVIDWVSEARKALNSFAMFTAQAMVDEIVKSTVQWANTGFEGGPAYVTDSGRYFTNLADGVAGEFIAGTDLNFMCSPFQRSVRISLVNSYYQPPETRFQCTLSEIKGNAEDFFDGNFSSGGGWDTWFAVTQNPTNNPYGAYLEAKVELDSRIASRIGLEQEQLSWSQGFLSWSECAKTDKDTGECLVRGPVQTPGTTIKAQLDKVLPSGLEKLVSVTHIEQLVGAFASGLLQRYVFGSQGLFGSDYGNHFTESNDPAPTTTCLASTNSAAIGAEVTWSAQSNLRSATYSWSGDEITPQEGTSISVVYQNPGIKRARISVLGISPSGRPSSANITCANSVNVGNITVEETGTETPPSPEDPDDTGTQPKDTETF